MKKRIISAAVVLVFFAALLAVVLTTPKLKRSESKAERSVNVESKEELELDYSRMTEKELLVLAYDGDPEACYRLGMLYDYGAQEVQQNFTNAMEWYRTADALGQKNAACAIGYLYLNGCGAEKDPEYAKLCFDRAVEQGDAQGYVGLGRLSLDSAGTDASMIENFKLAKNAGVLDGVYYLGYVYEKGLGTKRRPQKAFKLYEEAAFSDSNALEDQYPIKASMTRLGILYMKGLGTEKDYDAAIEWFERAAEGGSAMAAYYLGIIYEMGYGVSVDYNRSLSWLESAAQQDYAPAYNEIGCMYFNGYGVDVNYEEAVYYQKLAAALGYEKAQVNLGYLYENGYGVTRDLSMALLYYRMAMDAGYPGADEAVSRVHQMMEADQQ